MDKSPRIDESGLPPCRHSCRAPSQPGFHCLLFDTLLPSPSHSSTPHPPASIEILLSTIVIPLHTLSTTAISYPAASFPREHLARLSPLGQTVRVPQVPSPAPSPLDPRDTTYTTSPPPFVTPTSSSSSSFFHSLLALSIGPASRHRGPISSAGLIELERPLPPVSQGS